MGTDKMMVTLRALPKNEKLILANIYQQLAKDLIEQVEHANKTARQWHQDGLDLKCRHGIPDAMISALQTLQSEDDAIMQVAQALATTPESVRHHWAAHKKDEARQARLIRDREILKMARKGLSNAEIARRFGISRPYVSKIVSRDFRRFARYGDHSLHDSQ
jgi:DNA-directed RNA polymerase specialized sigma subunit